MGRCPRLMKHWASSPLTVETKCISSAVGNDVCKNGIFSDIFSKYHHSKSNAIDCLSIVCSNISQIYPRHAGTKAISTL